MFLYGFFVYFVGGVFCLFVFGFFPLRKYKLFFIQAIRKERDCYWFFSSFPFKLISLGKTGKFSGTQSPRKT